MYRLNSYGLQMTIYTFHLMYDCSKIKCYLSDLFALFAGTIPAPILFGVAIDQSCRLWRTPCNAHGGRSCLFYNNNVMSDYMMAIGIACKSFAGVLFLLSYILYKRFNDRRSQQTGNQTSKDSLEQTIEANATEPVVDKDK